jgi:hypothetical protein
MPKTLKVFFWYGYNPQDADKIPVPSDLPDNGADMYFLYLYGRDGKPIGERFYSLEHDRIYGAYHAAASYLTEKGILSGDFVCGSIGTLYRDGRPSTLQGFTPDPNVLHYACYRERINLLR